MKKRRVAAILFGTVPPNARLDDQDTLNEVRAVSKALIALGFSARTVPLSLNIGQAIAKLRALSPAFVFNLVESVETHSRFISMGTLVLDHLGLPYTGCKTDAICATSNKTYAKQILSLAGLPTPDWQEATEALKRCRLRPPFILKPKWEHASVGLDESSILTDPRSLSHKLRKKPAREYFIEQFIDGREFNVSALGKGQNADILPCAEIDFSDFAPGKPRIVGYKAKWETDSFEYNHTPRRFDFLQQDRKLLKDLKRCSLQCWKAFSLCGYARVDFRVDRQNRPFVLEVNANPCISPDAGFAAAAARAGMSYADLIERIVSLA